MDKTRLNLGQIEAVLFGFKDIKEDVYVPVSEGLPGFGLK